MSKNVVFNQYQQITTYSNVFDKDSIFLVPETVYFSTFSILVLLFYFLLISIFLLYPVNIFMCYCHERNVCIHEY